MSGVMKVYCEMCKKFPEYMEMTIKKNYVIIECAECGSMQKFSTGITGEQN